MSLLHFLFSHSLFSFHSPFFLFDFYVTSFLSYLFASFLSHSFLLISLYYLLCLPSSPSLCIANAFLYCLLWWVLLFYLSTTFVWVWVSFLDHSLVCQLPRHHHFPVLAVPRSIPRQKSVVLFSYSPWHSHPDKSWAFSLTNSYGTHLVILAHLSLFWVVCHSSRTFPPKELEREPYNGLPPSPYYQTIPSLTSDSWHTAPILAGYKWVVLEPCACCTSMWF